MTPNQQLILGAIMSLVAAVVWMVAGVVTISALARLGNLRS